MLWKVLHPGGMADMARNVWKWLEMTGNGWDGWELLEMAEPNWIWLDMTENGWNCQIWIQMARNVFFLDD